MPQNNLLNKIAKKLPTDTSVIQAVADTLEISYQSAQRRVNSNAKITIDEAILLAKRYGVSLDLLYDTGDKNTIAVKKTEVITGLKDFENYFKSFDTLKPLINMPESKVIYSAKDLPIFHSSKGILAKFKLFIWLKILDPNFIINDFSLFKLSASLIKAYDDLGTLYKNINVTEIWDITTINSTLKQLHFYTSTEVISKEDAVLICNELVSLLNALHTRINKDSNYKLYYNELLLMSNNVLIDTPVYKSVFIPFTLINYFNTVDPLTCEQFSKSIDHQISQSKLLNTSGEKEKKVFFNKIIKKVTDLKSLLENEFEYDLS